jgi:D-alanyl-D-alanine carboxypeptidase/D-alanyl-D-alanine-endopeptidase (penicillin-binding protein 4)
LDSPLQDCDSKFKIQNAKPKMRNASITRPRVAFAFCILHFAFPILSGCAKAPASTAAPVTRAAAATAGQLRQAILAETQRPGVQHGIWGIAVRSLDRREALFELNPATLLVPASAAKLLAVASGVEAQGWNYRFETALRTNGAIADGVLHGDLVVRGSGDPSIGGRGGDGLTAWVEALKSLGIHRIDGRIIGDDDALEEPRPGATWAWDDLGYTSGALFGALNFAENRLAVTVTPSPAEGGPTSLAVEPLASSRPMANRTVTGATGSQLLVWPEQRPGESHLTIAGSVPAGAQPARLFVSAGNPTLWFASVLRSTLIAGGIDVSGDPFDIDDLATKPDAAVTLYTHQSKPLADIAQPLLKDSINLYGEAFMRLNVAAGVVFPTNDAARDGLRRRLGAWGIAEEGQQLVDGSGLSRRDVLTADTLVIVLARMYDPTGTSAWMRALPIAGVDGTLDGRMKGTPAEGNVRAKTGTMSNVRSLAGYVTTRDGEHLAFAIIVNNFEGTGAQATQAIDAIAVRLAGFSRGGP